MESGVGGGGEEEENNPSLRRAWAARARRGGKVSAAPAAAQARGEAGEASPPPHTPPPWELDSPAGPHCCRGAGAGGSAAALGAEGRALERIQAGPGEGGKGRARARVPGRRGGGRREAGRPAAWRCGVSFPAPYRPGPEAAQRPAEVMRNPPQPQQAWLLPPDASIV